MVTPVTVDLTPIYDTAPTAEQAAWLADPPAGDWLTLLDQVPAFMWEGIDRQWLPPEPRIQAGELGAYWFPRPTVEALALTFRCWSCHAQYGEPCIGRRTHAVRTDRAIRSWNRAVLDAPFAEHRVPGHCYVTVVSPA